MSQRSILQFLNPWKLKREREAARLAALRHRDGDSCARCRRPMRFDLPRGYDQVCTIEPVSPAGGEGLDNFRLCHTRCNPSGKDHTGEARARVRRESEAALFDKARKSRAA
ncbi:hypothetical protein [Sphingomonas alba]|uniref:HNH endonuclease n=1 Tax=Sphingomonas alba TaxID=2908208 RepID=A0ABT0RN09_9SPHN|nr:hypothetical protein [Sphingomonas alba]MCL6684026.1 hypothetical protein [Sphingomonas alba]